MDEASALEHKAIQSLAHYEHLIVTTHAPPFREAAHHQDGPFGDEQTLPFVYVALGKDLLTLTADYAAKKFTGLCGHNRQPFTFQAATNLRVIVADRAGRWAVVLCALRSKKISSPLGDTFGPKVKRSMVIFGI